MKRSKPKPDRAVVLPGQMDLFADAPARVEPREIAVVVHHKPVAAATNETLPRVASTTPAIVSSEPSSEKPRRLTLRRPRKEPGRLLDVGAAANYVGLSASTLNKMRCLGEGPKFLKLTRSAVRYDPADLDAWLSVRKRASTSEV